MTLALKLICIFGVIGVLDTVYLVYHKIMKTDVACPFFPKEWCRTVQYARQSKTFGIPNSFLGLLMYVLILLFAWFSVIGISPIWPLQGIIAFGFLFSLYFMYVQAFVLRAFCTWCVISFINFLVMAVAVFLL